jgi:hypothetical protein
MMSSVVAKHQQKIDLRPFKSKAEHEREQALQEQYRGLAIPDVVAALKARKPREGEPPASD